MEEFVVYGLALGITAAFIVPLLVSIAKKIFPASWSQMFTGLPSSYPQGTGIFWSVIAWGLFLGTALWLVAQLRPVRRAIQEVA